MLPSTNYDLDKQVFKSSIKLYKILFKKEILNKPVYKISNNKIHFNRFCNYCNRDFWEKKNNGEVINYEELNYDKEKLKEFINYLTKYLGCKKLIYDIHFSDKVHLNIISNDKKKINRNNFSIWSFC